MIKDYLITTRNKLTGIDIIKNDINSIKEQIESDIKTEIQQMSEEIANLKKTIKQEQIENSQFKTLTRIRNKILTKQKINVLFLVIHTSVWQYDNLYKKFLSNKLFNPTIVIVPYTMYGDQNMIDNINGTFKYFSNKKYNVINTYNNKTKTFVDIKEKLKPDIIFFTNPHKITKDEYYINNFFQDTLTCYVPYGIMAANIEQLQYNQEFHNITWRNFYETGIHKKLAGKFATNKGKNVIVTGYPGCDIFLNPNHKPKNVWKKTNQKLKRVIWAPHHTIEKNDKEMGYSNFLKYHQIMLDIAKKYEKQIQFAFKPHPILATKLKEHPDWGENKVSKYYKKWKNGKNTQLELDDYTNLFLTSDAMIMDSISFIAEYLYINKPCLFMIKDRTVHKKFNDFGLLAFKHLYKSYNMKNIYNFLNKVILKEKDRKKKQRQKFLHKYLIPPNQLNATDNIVNYIINTLK